MATGLPLAPIVPVPKFDATLGALLVGGLVATALYGLTVLQTFAFFTSNITDRAAHKALVAFLFVLDTFDTFLNGHILYFYLVTNYLSPQAIATPVWSLIIHVAATSLSNFIVRSAFARRVYRLSNGNIPGTFWIVSLSVLDLVFLKLADLLLLSKFRITTFLQLDGSIATLMYLNFAAGTSSDLSVALALCYLLHGSRTGFPRTDSLIGVLMVYTVNTGLLVALDASAGMITFIFMQNNFIFLAFYLLLSKLYLNSYLAALNVRKDLREKFDEPKSIRLSRIHSEMHWRSSVGYDPEAQRSDSQSALPIIKSDSGNTIMDTAMDAHPVGEKGADFLGSSDIARAY
ncbi:hypothetical protein MSAN_00221100 [Mycena sanguinolenta]|uniref:DUF6534 domain-containing protein n=1 Tax=Mycena sanguinolenta TaxID=230812 RepID=A0A8H6ZHN7_9AGAR|nr:hypothetical protein MSAN_00221100 [Mycena sanguinolenta]